MIKFRKVIQILKLQNNHFVKKQDEPFRLNKLKNIG